MSETKRCGNCKSFIPSIDGFGACAEPTFICGVHCNNEACSLFKMKSNNGWTEITPDNVDDIYNLAESRFVDVLDSRIMVVKGINDWCWTLSTMSKMGGYYYYVLPELKIE